MNSDAPELFLELRAGRPSTPEVIADVLRAVILRGHFTGGQPLRQDDIGARFGVSRIPVREALRQLSAEGLVEFHAKRGAVVAHLQPDEAEEILEIRSALEIKAAALAMPSWTEATFSALASQLDEAESCDSIDRWSDLNRSFHEGLYGPCRRPRLLGMIRTLNDNIERYIRLLVSRSGYRLQAEREHRAILASAQVRNPVALSALIEQHAMETASQLRHFLAVHDAGPAKSWRGSRRDRERC